MNISSEKPDSITVAVSEPSQEYGRLMMCQGYKVYSSIGARLFEIKCITPIYEFRSRNVLGNGLVTVIPSIAPVMLALQWQWKFDKFEIVSKAELKQQMQNVAYQALNIYAEEEERRNTQMDAMEAVSSHGIEEKEREGRSRGQYKDLVANLNLWDMGE